MLRSLLRYVQICTLQNSEETFNKVKPIAYFNKTLRGKAILKSLAAIKSSILIVFIWILHGINW